MPIDGNRIRGEIIQILKDHDGKPCPSNIKLAELLRIPTRRVSDFLFLLAQEGSIIKHGQQCARSFTVVKTGSRTLPQYKAAPIGLPKWSVLEMGKKYQTKAAPLPPHVWYGRRGPNGERIDDQGNLVHDHHATRPI